MQLDRPGIGGELNVLALLTYLNFLSFGVYNVNWVL